jgi:tetratricopeptide (TPR) repeat protein
MFNGNLTLSFLNLDELFMKTVSSYLKNRIYILLLAGFTALFSLLIFSNDKGKKESVEISSDSKIKLNKVIRAKPKATKPVIKPVTSTNSNCTLTPPVEPTPLKEMIIPLFPPVLSKENSELQFHVDKANLKLKVTIESVEHYHKAGKIILAQAFYLKTLLGPMEKGEKISLPENSGMELPSSVAKTREKISTLIIKAQQYLSNVRPLPKYRLWSEALYLNATALFAMGNPKKAETTLKIISRTKSKAKPAQYARFAMGILLSKNGHYSKALKYIKKSTIEDSKHLKLKNYYLLLSKIGSLDDIELIMDNFRNNTVINAKFMNLILFHLSDKCSKSATPLICVKTIIKHIKPKLKKPTVAWTWKKLAAKNRKNQADSLCKLYKGLK